MKVACAIVAAAGLTAAANADVVYDADFSVSGIGWEHTTSSPAPAAPASVSGPNYTLSYDATPATDTSLNYFETAGGVLESSDWGGDHSFESFDIDVSSFDEVSVDFINDYLGSDSFNASTEFIEYFFTLDNGSEQQFFFFTGTPNGSNLNASTTIDVSGASTLTVGLNANVNGGGDGFTLSAVTVTGTPVPAPGAFALLGLGGLCAARRRRA